MYFDIGNRKRYDDFFFAEDFFGTVVEFVFKTNSVDGEFKKGDTFTLLPTEFDYNFIEGFSDEIDSDIYIDDDFVVWKDKQFLGYCAPRRILVN